MTPDINKAQKYYQKKNYQKALDFAYNIKSKKAYFIIAESLFAKKEYKNAIPYYKCLLKNNVKDPWLANHLSQCYEAIGDYNNAIELGFMAIELAPSDNDQHINFAYLLYEVDNKKAVEKWQKKYGKNPIVSHFADSLLHNKQRNDSNPEYIKEIFNSFSNSFEEVLKSLDYNAPTFIKNELKKLNIKNKHILDLGCGTGLCGKIIKKHCAKKGLYGVDISSKMLDKAQEKNIYHNLIEADIDTYLQTTTNKFDCIVAADVLTYFGELKTTFRLVNNALKNDGFFVFTITKNISDSSSVLLHSSGRFHHSEKYIKNLLKKEEFLLKNIEEKTLRQEGDKPVKGFVICAQKKL